MDILTSEIPAKEFIAVRMMHHLPYYAPVACATFASLLRLHILSLSSPLTAAPQPMLTSRSTDADITRCCHHPMLTSSLSQLAQLDDASELVKISHLNVAAPVPDGADPGFEKRLAAVSEGSSTSLLINDFNLEVKRGQHTLVRGMRKR